MQSLSINGWEALRRQIMLIVLGLCVSTSGGLHSQEKIPQTQSQIAPVRITVTDSVEGKPINLARVLLLRNGRTIAQGATNPLGQLVFRDVLSGGYEIVAWFVGYESLRRDLLIDADHATVALRLKPRSNQVDSIEIYGKRDLGVATIDLKSGNQTFESETYHAPPTARMTTLIQENMAGAARAPTSEVHIRGEHGEFTYYIDGIPVPLGVFGGLNEVVDPKVIDRATFITGGFPAEYGGQMSAVIDLQNRVPTGSLHLDWSSYVGSYLVFNGTKPFTPGNDVASGMSSSIRGDTLGGRVGPLRALNANGQSLSMSDHIGALGFYLSGSRQETDRRIDTPVPNLFHDHGFDYFLYGKFDYVLSDRDYVTANLNVGRTATQVPYDPAVLVASDFQQTTNSFQALSYFRELDTQEEHEANIFLGAYARQGGLVYSAGAIDPYTFHFGGDTVNSYQLSEDRSFNTFGVRSTFDKRFSPAVKIKTGLTLSSTAGTELFTSRDSLSAKGPSIRTNFAGSDFGAFVEGELRILDWLTLQCGMRYDQHIAPDVALQRQVSPRIRADVTIDENNSGYVYYGRLFMPTNIEGLRSIAQNVSSSVTPTYPERSDFYELVYLHQFPSGLRLKAAGFFKHARPFTDDAAIGNTAIKTPFNIATVRTSGVEMALSYDDPEIPLSGHMNASVIHALGSGELTGGFLPPSSDGPATDLDHDQRISLATGVTYQPGNWFVSAETTYGSGLSNGSPGNVAMYETGLFDLNQAAHTTPYWIVDCSGGYSFPIAGGGSLKPSLYVTNLLNHIHLLKGAYTTGASWEEPRNVILKISIHW